MAIKELIKGNEREVKDVFYLIALQGLNYLAPIVVLPYLMVVLGAEKFGCIGFALAVCQYLMIVVDFGFNLSATKRIALAKGNQDELNKILITPHPSMGFDLMDKAGMLQYILPDLLKLKGVQMVEGRAHKENFSHTLQVVDNLAVRLSAGSNGNDLNEPLTLGNPKTADLSRAADMQKRSTG